MIELRHYQKGCTPAIIGYVRKNPGKSPVVALPTGSGKTLCIADLIKYCSSKWGVKIIVLSHVKEILEQNIKTIERYIGRPVSVNSSMLGRREVGDITIAGIQSVFRSPAAFKGFKLVIIDEAHLVSVKENTMYQKFISGIGDPVCVGFTATPFRLGSGLIYGESENAMFDDLCYDWTSSQSFVQLVEEGYLSKLTTKRTKLEMDTSGVRMQGGDFNEKQLSAKFDRDGVTREAIKEIIAAGANRKKWLIFAIDIDHAEHIAELLIRNGISAAVIHSKMAEYGFDREDTIKGFASGKFKAIVNVNILTTGFDEPGVDLIAVLRPTMSPVLHVQMLGRGSRISPGKENCLVLDFAGNTIRLGPINDVKCMAKKTSDKEGEAPAKHCPQCESVVPAGAKFCPDCNYEFLFEHKLSPTAADSVVIVDDKPFWLEVIDVDYSEHANYGMTKSVKVTYMCESNIAVSEWVCVEHKGYAKYKADHWVKYRGGVPCNTVIGLLEQASVLKKPSKILVVRSKKYYSVKDAVF